MLASLRESWATKKMHSSWEPDWHIPANTIRAATLLNVPHIATIDAALGAVTFVDDLRWTRNAIVHNVPMAFSKYRAVALNRYALVNVPPHQFIAETNPISGRSLYEDWCEELSLALELAR